MLEMNESNFEKEVKQHQGICLVDFWAPWCGPCLASAPLLEEISKQMEGKAKFVKVNVDENDNLASEYGIMSIPTFVFLKDGKEIERRVGVQSKEEIVGIIEKLNKNEQ